MRDTWYVLEDGKVADPAEVVSRPDGRLLHKSGVLVAMRGDVPSSRGVDVEEERAKQALRDGEISADEARTAVGKEPIPERRPYRTRDMKAKG